MSRETLTIMLIALFIASPVDNWLTYKYGRKVMYAQVCEKLGVTEHISFKIGRSTFFHDGIFTQDAPLTQFTMDGGCKGCHGTNVPHKG